MWFAVRVTLRGRPLLAVAVAAGLVAAVAFWGYLTGSHGMWPVWPGAGILLGALVLLVLMAPLTRSRPRLLVPAGGMVGVVVAVAAAFAMIHGAPPGTDALVVYGVTGLIVGLAVGLAFAAARSTSPRD